MLRRFAFLALAIPFLACPPVPEEEVEIVPEKTPFELVNVFVGTGGHGHTHPAATLPFGMVQAGPDTRLEGWDGCSGYHASDRAIYGFSHTHLSGTGVSDYGDVLLMPFVGEPRFGQEHPHAAAFRKEREKAEPGWYAVTFNNGISAEISVTRRAAIHRYRFPAHAEPRLWIDLDHRDEVLDAGMALSGKHAVSGYRISKAWAEEQHVYFALESEREIAGFTREGNRAFLEFAIDDEDRERKTIDVVVKVGISAVDETGAAANLAAELPGFDLDSVRQSARATWTAALERIEVRGGAEWDRSNFYTALYHSLLAPNLFSDVDGRYRGMDRMVHRAEGHEQYTVFSLWDTYRATHPLFTLIERDRTNDFIRTLLAQHRDGGILPIWELAGNYTGCMIGYHGISVIADAHAKGIADYDAALALEAMVHAAEQDHLGLANYKKSGAVLADGEAESVSKTLEYSYDDWCIARMADALGETEIAGRFGRRAQNWKHLFDPDTRFFRPRMNGAFVEPFDPSEVNFHFTEANAWQYAFAVQHDVAGMVDFHGGPIAFADRLDSLFGVDSRLKGRDQADITGLIGQYAQGNEPSHHLAYLYNYVGQPWKTQEKVRTIMREFYSPVPAGLIGNEDCGQMSSWYVLSAAGFYPVTPGDPLYAIGSPLFDTVVFHFEDGERFTIVARGNDADHPYIRSATLNGEPFESSFLRHEDIVAGGELVFEMSRRPVLEWGVTDGAAYQTPRFAPDVTPAPFAAPAARTFDENVFVTLRSADPEAKIYWQLDGATEWIEYIDSFSASDDFGFDFYAEKDGVRSPTQYAEYHRRKQDWSIALASEFAPQYAAGGELALIDGWRGSPDFRTGLWQGYEGQDLEAVVDLGSVQSIRRAELGCLQDENSWIFFPLEVQFSTSRDGERWEPYGVAPNGVSPFEPGAILRSFTVDGEAEARYVKVVAKSRIHCPEGHKGEGGKSWVFADEIVVGTTD